MAVVRGDRHGRGGGWGRDPGPPLPQQLPALTCRADDGPVVVHAGWVGVAAGCRGRRAAAGVELPDRQGEADGKQQQGREQAGRGPGQPASLVPAGTGVLSQGWGGGPRAPRGPGECFPKD